MPTTRLIQVDGGDFTKTVPPTKDPVRLATTANHGLSGLSDIDGVTPIADDRILVKSQSAPAENGIYVAASGAWSRAVDGPTGATDLFYTGTTVFVTEGDANGGTFWTLTTTGTITIGTTGTTFEQRTAPAVDEIIYVNKAGDDANDGLSPSSPKLTLSSAITAASAQSPTATNIVEIRILGGAQYTSSALTLPDYVNLNAPEAIISGTLTVGTSSGDCRVRLNKITPSGTGAPTITIGTTGWVSLDIDYLGSGANAADQALAVTTDAYLSLRIGYLGGSGAATALYAPTGIIWGRIDWLRGGTSANGVHLANVGDANATVRGLYIGEMSGASSGISISHDNNTNASFYVGYLNGSGGAPYAVTHASGVLNLFAGDIVGTPGTVTGTANVTEAGASGGISTVDAVIYVNKAGSDSNDGLSVDTSKLTIAAAITAANLQSPSTTNRIEIRILGGGRYAENFTLPDFVSLNGSTATVVTSTTTGITMQDGCIVRLGRIETSGVGIRFSATTDEGWAHVDEILSSGTNPAVYCDYGLFYVNVGRIVATSSGSGITLSETGDAILNVGSIQVATGIGIEVSGTGPHTLSGWVGSITDSSTGTGIGMSATSAKAELSVGLLDCTTTYAVASGNTLGLTVGDLVGSIGTINGTANISEAGAVVDEIIYVNKAGDDSSDGLSAGNPKLTLASAITAASAQTPSASNRVEIRILGGGTYTENPTLPDYVSINGPEAILDGYFTGIGNGCRVKLHKMSTATTTLFNITTTGERWIDVEDIGSATQTTLLVNHATAQVTLRLGYVTCSSAVAIYVNAGLLRGSIGRIYSGGANCIGTGSTGVISNLNVGWVNDSGSSLGISHAAATTANITVLNLDTNTSYAVTNASGVLNMFANQITGTPGTVTGTANVLTPVSGGGTIGGSTGATDNAVLTADGTGGSTVQASNLTTDAAGNFLLIPEQATQPSTTAGRQSFWSKNDGQGEPYFSGDLSSNYMQLTRMLTLARTVSATQTDTVELCSMSPIGPLMIAIEYYGTQISGNAFFLVSGANRDTVGSDWVRLEPFFEDLTYGATHGNRVALDIKIASVTIRVRARVEQRGGTTPGAATMTCKIFNLVRTGQRISESSVTDTGVTAPTAVFRASTVKMDGRTGQVYHYGPTVQTETGTSPTVEAGEGSYWVRDDVPSVPVFTTDSGSDISILTYPPVKRPCKVATTGNHALSGTSAVDGVSISIGDRVLVWQQTVATANGIYYAAVGSWTRAFDFDNATDDHIEAGIEVYVQQGDSYSRTKFTLVSPTGTITIGSDNLEFIPMGGLARTDASSTEVISSTAFSTSYNWSSAIDMRDHSHIGIFFNPTDIGSNTEVWIAIQWSDDGSTIAWGDDNFQQSDFDITNQTDGTYNPKDYVAHLTTAGGELATNKRVHLGPLPKGAGQCKIGILGDNASGAYTVRTQRLVL